MINPYSHNGPDGSFLFNSGSKYFRSANGLLNSEIKGTTQKFSIEIWFKRVTVDGTYQTIFSRDQNSSARQFACEFDPSEKWTFFIADSDTKYSWWKTVDAFTSTSVWYHLVATFDNNQSLANKCVIYINGLSQATARTDVGGGVSSVNDQASLPIYIAVTDFTTLINPIKGYLNKITFYNDVLTATDVANLYAGSGSVSLSAYLTWTLKSSSSSTLIENSIRNYSLSTQFTGSGMSGSDYSTSIPSASYDTDALSYIAAMSVAPDNPHKLAISELFAGLKTDSIYTTLDDFGITAVATQQAARLKCKSLGTITENGGLTWTADQGYTGNGSSGYLDTNYNPSTQGVQFTLNSNAIGAYNRLNLNEATATMGHANSGTSVTIITPRNGGNFLGKSVCNTNLSAANSDSRGIHSVRRTTSTSQQIFKRGTSQASGSTTSVSIPNNNIYVLCYNNNGSAALFSNNQVSFWFVGAGTVPQSTLETRVNNYMTRLGTNV
jgi:hypothetical protein